MFCNVVFMGRIRVKNFNSDYYMIVKDINYFKDFEDKGYLI